MRHVNARWWSAVVVAGLFVTSGGCGSEPFDYVPVSGKVTYEDGSLIPGEQLRVTFIPQAPPVDPKTHPRPGVATVNVADGTFDKVTSYKYGDGIVPGQHKVLIESFDAQEARTGAVPVEYSTADQTPLVVDAADAPFELKIPRPAGQ